MANKYEVVVLIDSSNSEKEIDNIKKDVDNLILSYSWKILGKDDIWYVKALFKIWSSTNPYFYSLYVELEPNVISDLKKKLWIMRTVVRSRLFRMKNSQKFLKFNEIDKELKDIDFAELTKSWIFNEMNNSK